MNPVVHFEMPADDMKRMVRFYEKAFGWEANQLGEDMGNYVVVLTSETNKSNMPKKPGRINGGFFKKNKKAKHPSVVIAVDNINKHIKIVEEAGGKVLGKPMNIPGIGSYVQFIDTEGNQASMIQPIMDKREV